MSGNKTILVSENKSLGVKLEGEYVDKGWGWVLVAWKITSTYEGRTTDGEWHRIHGNQKKDLGAMKLVRDYMPENGRI